MTSKKLPVTMPAWTCTGSPAPMRLKVSDENSATAASERAWLRMSTISGTENAVFCCPVPVADCLR